MKCEGCGCKLNVVSSRCSDDERWSKKIPSRLSFISGALTYRNLKCCGCGKQVKTIEVNESEIEKLNDIYKAKLLIDRLQIVLGKSK